MSLLLGRGEVRSGRRELAVPTGAGVTGGQVSDYLVTVTLFQTSSWIGLAT